MEHKLRVADLNLEVEYNYPTMLKQAKAYEIEVAEKINIGIKVPEEEIESLQADNPHLSLNDCEYLLTGAAFYESLLYFNGVLLHSSGVVVDDYAYLFTADPGTGKSTHTSLWRKYLGEERAIIINDDKPAIRLIDDDIYVYGTPWSGKTDQNINMRVKLGAIVCIEQSKENFIKELSSDEAIPLILKQTIMPRDKKLMNNLLDVLDTVLSNTKVYRLGCDMSEEAVNLSYNTIKRR
jgi:hypothetical protein